MRRDLGMHATAHTTVNRMAVCVHSGGGKFSNLRMMTIDTYAWQLKEVHAIHFHLISTQSTSCAAKVLLAEARSLSRLA